MPKTLVRALVSYYSACFPSEFWLTENVKYHSTLMKPARLNLGKHAHQRNATNGCWNQQKKKLKMEQARPPPNPDHDHDLIRCPLCWFHLTKTMQCRASRTLIGKTQRLNEKAQGRMASSTLAPPKEVDGKTSLVEDGVITEVKDNDSQLPIHQAEDKDTARHAEGSDDKVAPVNTGSSEHEHVKSHLKNPDKDPQCRYEDRDIGQGPDEGQGAHKASPKTAKHPRDDEDEDPNPRESKRPTPPPAPETKKSSPKPSPPSPKAAPKLVSGRLSLPLR